MLILILISVFIPIIAGVINYSTKLKRSVANAMTVISALICGVCCFVLYFGGFQGEEVLFKITEDIRFINRVDDIGCFFGILISLAFLIVSIFSLEYFKHDEKKNKFDCFFLISLGALMGLCFSGNLLTMYICFEMVTLFSMPLVLHDKTKESVDAALKYLIYSIGGAFLGFIGVVYFSLNSVTDVFSFGGIINGDVVNTTAFAVILFLMLIGFGAKCGLFPLHNWLPTAHPVAPAPASALLSGIITKSGVIAIIRIVYYVVGMENIRGTWVHTAWIILIMTTVLLGSFMAVVQKNLKKRLAFSTVSQVSYILLGLAMLDSTAFDGAFLQIASHAVIKIGLFLVAGVLIHCLNIHDVDELDGVGKKMPITMTCYTICALGLVGVPPTSGFIAKWFLASGALSADLGAISVIAPIVLIISAILTAYYLLSVTIKAFFPSDKTVIYKREKEPVAMVLPLIVLAVLSVVIGIVPSIVTGFLGIFA